MGCCGSKPSDRASESSMASTVSFFSIFGSGYGRRQKDAREPITPLEPIREEYSDLGSASSRHNSGDGSSKA